MAPWSYKAENNEEGKEGEKLLTTISSPLKVAERSRNGVRVLTSTQANKDH
jgi:hypothetical protein